MHTCMHNCCQLVHTTQASTQGGGVQSILDSMLDSDLILLQYVVNNINNKILRPSEQVCQGGLGGCPEGCSGVLAVMLITSLLGLGSSCRCAYRVAVGKTSLLTSQYSLGG